MKIDDFRLGVVRVCDGEGATRGTGFFVSQGGYVLTCDHVVRGAEQLSITMADGRTVPAELVPELSLPELDFAVLNTHVTPDFVVPVEFAGAVGDTVWTSGFQMQGQVINALPTMGKVVGQTSLQYSFGDRVYSLPECLRLEDALVEPGISGGCAALQRGIVAIGAVNAMLKDKGGFIVPFRAIQDQSCGLYKLLQQNRQTIARYGKHVNWPAIRELCQKSSSQILTYLRSKGQYSSELFVKRAAVDSIVERFLAGSSHILPIVGQTGTGKTNCSAHITENLGQQFSTSLLLAYRLTPQPDGLAATLAASISKAAPDIPVLESADVMRAIAESPDCNLIILLDGLNELPGTINAAREWIESTCEWLRAEAGVRLIVTCRPEYWNPAKELFAQDLLYVDRLGASHDELQSASQAGGYSFQLGDFSGKEAEEASRRYGFHMQDGTSFVRHPLLYNIARKAGGAAAMPSMDRLFHDFIDATVNEICAKKDPQIGFMLRAKLESLATTLRANKSLWIDRAKFLDTFFADVSIAGALLGEHLLVEGEGGVRFAFDETAHYLVSQASAKDFETMSQQETDWKAFRKNDPIGADSMPFFIASLEAHGKSEAIAKILDELAKQSHSGDEVESYILHSLFLRLLSGLRAPSAYFATILTFVESCLGQSNLRGLHSFAELVDLWGLSTIQQMQLLALTARRERDRGNRWKDWDKLSESEFWNDGAFRPGIATFRLTVKKVMERDPDTAIAALLEWLNDDTKLHSYSPPAEATVSDVACGLLYHSAPHWLDTIVDGLARMQSVQNAGYLLPEIARRNPDPMLDVCERWAKSREIDPMLPIKLAGVLMSMGPIPELKVRLVAILDTTLERDISPEIEATIAESLAADPSTASRALDIAEKLMKKSFPVDPWLLKHLIHLNPDRVVALLDSIIVHSRDSYRRESAVTALGELAKLPGRVRPLLAMVEGYLARYPELVNRLSCVVEEAFYATKQGTSDGNAVDAWTRMNYLKVPPQARTRLIDGVLNRAEKSPQGMHLLRTVIAAETPEDNLADFLGLLPGSRLPMEARLELVMEVATRVDERYPGSESTLYSVVLSRNDGYDRFLAETVAKNPAQWPETLVEYSKRVRAGEEPFDAAHKISTRELSKHPPRDSRA